MLITCILSIYVDILCYLALNIPYYSAYNPMGSQWEKFFETTSFRRRIDLANSHFDVVSTAYFDGEATSICEFDTKSHFAVKSILFFTIAFVSTVHFEGEATSICDFDTKSHYAEK